MFRFGKWIATAVLVGNAAVASGQQIKVFEGIGREATPREVAAWDIDVRADFKGLPKGSGSVADGMNLWDTKCASCHGTFGESNEVFTPLVGGTTLEDQKRGRVASLIDPAQPQRSTLMKVSTVSSLYDYIYRAMPWNEPRSLTPDDTYAVLAYLLNLGEIVPEDFVLSDQNIAQVQQKMPNRNGMTREHGFWSVNGVPDVKAEACMTNCVAEVVITSSLPDFARNAHENLAEQNRQYGPYRGADSTKPPLDKLPGASYRRVSTAAPAQGATADTRALFAKNGCAVCHSATSRTIGPSLRELSEKYTADAQTLKVLMAKVKQGGSGNWGAIPMPSHPQLSDDDNLMLVKWMVSGP